MPVEENNKTTSLKGPRRRYSVSTVLLLAALVISVVQYHRSGQVRWVTDSFRVIEISAKSLLGRGGTQQWLAELRKYWSTASQTLSELEIQARESGLDTATITRTIANMGKGVSGDVMGVSDGDTLKLLDAARELHTVRLTGIDAPERDQPYGPESSRNLEEMVGGKHIFVETSEKDDYGRLLGKVIVDGRDINLAQVEAGFAWWYRYHAHEQPREDRQAYEAAEDRARAERRGLWAGKNPIKPYEWRKGMGSKGMGSGL